MELKKSSVTIHMVASLDGFIARRDGSVDWMETADEFAGGDTMDPAYVEEFLKTIDCYVMGSRTYETRPGVRGKGFRLGVWRQTHVRTHDPASFPGHGIRSSFARRSQTIRE